MVSHCDTLSLAHWLWLESVWTTVGLCAISWALRWLSLLQTLGFWPNFKANWLLIWITPGCPGLIPFLKINTLKHLKMGIICVFVHHTHALAHKQLLMAWLSIVIVFSPTRQASCGVAYDAVACWSWGLFLLRLSEPFPVRPSPLASSCLSWWFNCLPQLHPDDNYSFAGPPF